MSVVLNSTAAVILEDLFKGCCNGRPKPETATYIVKGCILVLGVVAMVLVFFIEKLGAILAVRSIIYIFKLHGFGKKSN